ncbi:MAG: HD domain-containing protein [Microgenomates group bacterium]
MNISAIYAKYSIPQNLQTHMLRVAALGSLICDELNPELVDKDLVVKTLLLHDMGNILKFDFERLDLFEDEDKKNVEKYKKAQQDFKSKYGSDPDVATLMIIGEVTNDTRVGTLCKEAHWLNLQKYLNTNRWNEKICTYCDMRTGPFGLLSLTERIHDLKIRRPKESADLDVLLKQGLLVEQKLKELTQGRVSEITSEQVEDTAKLLKAFDV